MEKQPEDSTRVQITRAVFDGLEFIRRSGVTNMLDRPMVLNLAREWEFPETADWIESVDTATYARLIFQGPDVVDADPGDQPFEIDLDNQDIDLTPSDYVDENEVIDETNDTDVTEVAMDHVRRTMHDLLSNLGKHAILTIADTYEIQRMGVMVNPSRNNLIASERHALIRNLGQGVQLVVGARKTMLEAQRGVGSLQYLIDPENTLASAFLAP